MKTISLFAFALLVTCGVARAADGSAPKPIDPKLEEARELKACAKALLEGLPKIPADRAKRFQGKVTEAEAICRGERNLAFRLTPWVDWSQYWGTGDGSSLPTGYLSQKGASFRGVAGALIDLETERVELIKFNLFDNSGTWRSYVN